MIWFVARLLLEAVHSPVPSDDPLFEDRLVLLQAADEAEAQQRARARGAEMNAAESYETLDGDHVTWKLREVLDLQEVLSDQLLDGTDLFSTFLGRKEAQALLRMMKEPVGTS